MLLDERDTSSLLLWGYRVAHTENDSNDDLLLERNRPSWHAKVNGVHIEVYAPSLILDLDPPTKKNMVAFAVS